MRESKGRNPKAQAEEALTSHRLSAEIRAAGLALRDQFGTDTGPLNVGIRRNNSRGGRYKTEALLLMRNMCEPHRALIPQVGWSRRMLVDVSWLKCFRRRASVPVAAALSGLRARRDVPTAINGSSLSGMKSISGLPCAARRRFDLPDLGCARRLSWAET
jgi:hypothetical protein